MQKETRHTKPLIVDKQPIKYKFPKNIYQK